jgi:hypothetical protein
MVEHMFARNVAEGERRGTSTLAWQAKPTSERRGTSAHVWQAKPNSAVRPAVAGGELPVLDRYEGRSMFVW